jgi:ribosomal protein L12E/L44/L45/RPP1/RPP2
LRRVKNLYNGVEVAIVGKITGCFSPTVPPAVHPGVSRRGSIEEEEEEEDEEEEEKEEEESHNLVRLLQ